MNLEPAIFAGVAAILAIQPSVYRTWKQMFDQIITNTIGAVIALFFLYLLGESPITVGLVIMIVISLSLKMKMESTIPLTLITVLAIMSAPGNEDLLFTLNRFWIILVGTGSAILVNLMILPPKYQTTYLENIQSTFQNMSLLLRTAISNEMTEKSFEELNKKVRKDILKLETQYLMFDEERGKLGRFQQLKTREVVVFRQLLKTLQKGEQLLETIEWHFFQSKANEEDIELFDQQLEQLIKCHEYLLLKYQGKVKENQRHDIIKQSDAFFERVLNLYRHDKEDKQRLMIITSSINDYTFHLYRLNQLIEQYLKLKE